MEKTYYSVATGKDNFLANIVNEKSAIRTEKDEKGNEYILTVMEDLVLNNIVMLIPNGSKVGILPFKDLEFGSEYVTVPKNQIVEIYFVKDSLATQVRGALSGITLAK